MSSSGAWGTSHRTLQHDEGREDKASRGQEERNMERMIRDTVNTHFTFSCVCIAKVEACNT